MLIRFQLNIRTGVWAASSVDRPSTVPAWLATVPTSRLTGNQFISALGGSSVIVAAPSLLGDGTGIDIATEYTDGPFREDTKLDQN